MRAVFYSSKLQMKPIDLALTHRLKNAVAQALIVSLQAAEQLLHILALGVLILGAWVLVDRQVCVAHVIFYVLFLCIKERTDQVQIGIGKVGDGREATDASLKKQV